MTKRTSRLSKKAKFGLVAALTALSIGFAPLAAHADSGATVLGSWSDAGGRSVFVRIGTYSSATGKGFGMEKIQLKHQIYLLSSLKFISANPNGGTAEGSDRSYSAYANEKQCDSDGICEYIDSVSVTEIMSHIVETSYYGVTINGQIGIKTAYCNNSDNTAACPSWVENGLNHPAAVGTAAEVEAARTTTSIDWSYSPLATSN